MAHRDVFQCLTFYMLLYCVLNSERKVTRYLVLYIFGVYYI